jgi:hypothetical protein
MERSLRWGRSLTWAAVLVVGVLPVLVLALHRRSSLAGDPYAIYYPVAQNLLRGFGLDSFGPLWLGPGRHPGYPMLLAVVGLFTPELHMAGLVVGVLSAVGVFVLLQLGMNRERVSGRVVVAAVAVLASSYVYLRSAVEALPDMACVALLLAAVVLLAAEEQGERGWLRTALAGVACGLAAAVRPNAPVIIPAALLSIVMLNRQRRLSKGALFLVGFGLGFSPLLGPWLGLNAAGMEYPIPRTFDLLELRPSEDKYAGLLRLLGRGIVKLPARLAKTAMWPVALLGVPTIVWAALAVRSRLALTGLIFCAFLTGGLLPFHFEPRYYLYALVALAAAAPLGLTFVLRAARVPPSLVGPAFAVLVAALVVTTGRGAIADAQDEARVSRELDHVCEALGALAGSSRRTVVTGIHRPAYSYSYFRACPHPTGVPTNLALVPADVDALGLDAFIGPADGPLPAGDRLHAVASQVLVRVASTGTTTVGPSRELFDAPWSLRMPRAPKDACASRALAVPPGRRRLTVVLASDLPLAAELRLSTSLGARSIVGAGEDGGVTDVEVQVGEDGRLEAKLCAADPLVAPGRVEVRRLAIE